MSASRIGSAPITKQPVTYDIYNNFGVMGNEIVVREWKFEKKFCGCATTYYNILTDARLLTRTETTYCCSGQDYSDVSIFLRDIAELRRLREIRDNSECCTCCTRCYRSPEIIEMRGAFGSKMLYIPKEDMKNLQIEISAVIGNHKLISHH